ncbi:hypothetical protein [Kribbella sp. NPDC051620]|uniref:hypothetical protein n=1 Tax=Kribbella sp. NPDC051620 TaxID=3364120 RepID=UPI0037BA84BD
MTSRDLKDLLQTMASDGTDRVPVDEQTLIPRIRSRRRRRAGLAAAVAASTAVVIAAGAYAVLPGSGGGDEQPVAAPPQPTITIKPGQVQPVLACGAKFSAPLAGDPSMKLEVTQQVVTRDDRGGAGPISVQLTNTTGKPLDLFDTPGGPSIFVVKDGVVVATALAQHTSGYHWKFAPGETRTLKTAMSTTQCIPGDLPGSKELAPGAYQIYAVKNFMQYSDVQLPKVPAAGGPWTVELK